MNLRFVAVTLLLKVIQKKHSLSDVLAQSLPKLKNPQDRAFVQALCFGVCRYYFQLDAIAKQLLEKPLKQKDQDIYLLILVGLYQLREMRLPDYAAISETVNATIQLKKLWAKNLINAILRNYQRHPNFPISRDDDADKITHPAWMIEKIRNDWPNHWQAILKANDEHPPLALRVNQKKITRDNYLKKITAFPIPETVSGVYLETPMDIQTIPGFFEGEVSVQDGAAQLAASLLQIEPGQKVLDACAAPGGKTAHILESANSIELIAVDHNNDRLNRVKDNLNRLQLHAACICSDVGDTAHWWDGNPFDRILLDAPCSATGVIRRHPDIKLLRRESDIFQLTVQQSHLLNALWPLLKRGGLLLYATCSIFSDENMNTVLAFMKSHPDAIEEKIQANWGIPCQVGRQILPSMHGMDGFYYASLRKC